MNSDGQMRLSVLIVDNDPAVLVFTARFIEASWMRPLMARTSAEAVEIAHNASLPIDVVLANAALVAEGEKEILDRIRPGVRHLSMSAEAADGIIRVQPLICISGAQPEPSQVGLIESIRHMATPLVRTLRA